MSDRPSDGMRFDELRDEFDWMFEFQSRMAEHIRNDPDVHSLAGYVSKLEEQNAKLRELVQGLWFAAQYLGMTPDGATGSGFSRQMRKLGVEP